MQKFKPSKLMIAILSTGMISVASPAFSADSTNAEPANEKVSAAKNKKSKQDKKSEKGQLDKGTEVTVTGIRGSLARAQAYKMENSSIIEAISAEDIGKLPDSSVAESLARLSGVAGERRNGRTSGLAVRGFNENYIGTSLNGRELLGMGDNRGVEFDLYPSEIVSSILVYKTPDATLLNQGIGGTVDLQTVSPLTADATITFNGTYEKNDKAALNPDFNNDGSRFSFNYVDQFADDTLGVALVLTTEDSVRQEEQFRGWGYATVNTSSPRRATDTVTVPDGTVVLGGQDSFVRSAKLRRDSAALVIEYVPTEKLKVKLDALYIDFKESDARRGIEAGGAEWGTGDYTITGVENGLVTSGYYDGFYNVIRNDSRTQDATLKTYGLNFNYDINEDWNLGFDLSTGDVDKNITDIESYSGVGRAGTPGRPLSAYSFQMTSHGAFYTDHPTIAPVNNTDPNLIRLAGPQAWGGGMRAIYPADADFRQDGFVNQPIFNESLDSFRLDLDGAIEFGIFNGFKTGINYSDRSKSKTNDGFFLTAPTFPGDGPIPDPIGTVNLGFIGLGEIIAYDGRGLYDSGFYDVTDAALVDNARLGDTYTISEKVTTGFAELEIDTEIGDIPVRGNIGVQIVHTNQSATGFSTSSDAAGFTHAVPVSGGDKYTDILPSLNLSFEIAENQFIRTALSKVQSRPRLDDMRPNKQVSFQFNDTNILSTDPANSAWSGSSGNPKLRPLEANQFDLSYENYFADDGFFAVSFFFKDLTNWQKGGVTTADFSDSYIPGFHQTTTGLPPATFLGSLSFREDGLKGFVRGWEYQAKIPFRLINDTLDGLGVIFSATFMDGKLGDDGRVPGLSQENYSLTAYYERNGFEFRISGTKRDDFLTETRGLSLALQNAVDQGGEVWDAQVSYDFSESSIDSLQGLRVSFQVQNLTDEPSIQANENDPRQITLYQSYGANYLLSFNYSL